jgi:Fur family ferric uptake transcriptional regulator
MILNYMNSTVNPSWTRILRASGYKLTGPRRAVVKVLEEGKAHLSPPQILRRGRRYYPTLSRATMYRTLELLRALKLVRPLFLGSGQPSYLVVGGDHHHCVCSECGKVIEFDQCGERRLTAVLKRRLGFQAQGHLLEFYGQCKECRS